MGRRFATELPPLQALRAWMFLLVDHVLEKKLILSAMRLVEGRPDALIAEGHGEVQLDYSPL